MAQGNAQALQAYQWRGNVRELQNVIERAVIIATNNRLDIRVNMPLSSQQNSVTDANQQPNASDDILTEEGMRDVYRHNIIRALQQTQGRVAGKQGAADLLGLKPSTLNSKIRSLKINCSEF
jgi:transcriptional regulator with GAF, ATPase, and Fis domain